MSAQEKSPSLEISLTVKKTLEALDFYTRAFGAQELYRIATPDGGIAHAEFQLENTRVYISDEAEDWQAFAMTEGSMASSLFVITTDNCDQSYQKSVDAGAKGLSDPKDQFLGVRVAIILDPYGYRWSFREVIEELSTEEVIARADKIFGRA